MLPELYGLFALFGTWGALLSAIVLHTLIQRRAASEAWLNAVNACGVTNRSWMPSQLSDARRLVGRAGALSVRLQPCRKGKVGTRVVIGAEHSRLSALTLRREDLGIAVRKRLGTRELELGDAEFDEQVYLEGPATLARAVLDTETRWIVRELLKGRFHRRGKVFALEADVTCQEGELRADLGARSAREFNEVFPDVLGALLDVARRLSPPEDLAVRLAQNVRQEPKSAVRLQDLVTLLREFPEHPATRETARAAVADEDQDVRLRAALVLGDEGRATLLELAASSSVTEPCSAQAIDALREHLPLERAQAILRQALVDRRLETAAAVLASLGRRRDPEALATIARALDRDEGGVAVAAARALGASGQGGAERPLIQALSSRDEALRVAAAAALGRLGSSEAVLPLKEAMARHPEQVLLQRTARQAVAEIQSRLTGAVPGQLSLADAPAAEAGQLSLADAEAGRLTLAESGAEPATD